MRRSLLQYIMQKTAVFVIALLTADCSGRIYFVCQLAIVKYFEKILQALQFEKNNSFFIFKPICNYDIM